MKKKVTICLNWDLYYKSFTIVIYDCNDSAIIIYDCNESAIIIYDCNDSGLYYKKRS
jgi:hypothetical protein